jgi:hypothetical protein
MASLVADLTGREARRDDLMEPDTRWRQADSGEWQHRADDGYWYPSDPPLSTVMSSERGSAARPHHDPRVAIAAWFALAGGVLMAVSGLLPWATSDELGGYSVNAYQIDGSSGTAVILLVIGVVASALAVTHLLSRLDLRFLWLTWFGLGGLAGVLVFGRYFDVNDWVNNTDGAAFGIGYMVAGFAAALTIASGLLTMAARRKEPRRPRPLRPGSG